jgi:hypothetical protein
MGMRDRRDPNTGEYRSLSWQSLLLMGLSNSEVKGAIIVSWRITNAVMILWVTGWLSAFGFPGPARAAEVAAAREEARLARIEGLEARMFDLRVKQCEAIKAGESARIYTIQLQQLMDRYFGLTQRQPSLPICEELR